MAVRLFEPTVEGSSAQEPVGTVSVQLALPSLTVTGPVGVPLPGETTATANSTATRPPTTEGSGVCEVITVLVCALSTW